MESVSIFNKNTGKFIFKASNKTPKAVALIKEGHVVIAGVDGGAPDFLKYDFNTRQLVPDTEAREEYTASKQQKEQRINRKRAAENFIVSSVNDPGFNWSNAQELKKLLRAMAIVLADGIDAGV